MLHLVRHGRTAVNAAGRLLGRRDPPLDGLGRLQAAAAARLVGPVHRVVTSPLERARETARHFDGTAVVDERFQELDYGDWEGRALLDVTPAEWDRWRSDITFAPPGGESLAALGRRVRAACTDLVEEAGAHDIVVVTHVSPVKAALAWALGVDDDVTWRTHVSPGSVTRIALTAGRPVLHGFNEVPGLPS